MSDTIRNTSLMWQILIIASLKKKPFYISDSDRVELRSQVGQIKTARGHPISCSNSSSGRSKRIRTIFTPEQLERLEAEFERQQYMVGPERLYLAHALQLTEAQGTVVRVSNVTTNGLERSSGGLRAGRGRPASGLRSWRASKWVAS
ncbi:unnamed protein product [Diatraea saccharalis]|uniref:Homeobox domain-containing protein n=1 Tax=Diatraea saccharalis TaxID=40085 RepID=A0A9N9WEI1_9NEOP|nr:unnamed protein product [Diatraea saccharalis]